MTIRQRKGLRAIAGLVLFSLIQVGTQVSFAEPNSPSNPIPIPQQFIARLTTRNNQPITVNGNSATTGASIVTGATIETGADQAATVNLGPLGSLDIAPNTKLVLNYDEHGNVKVTLITGCAILTTKKKTTGEVATEQGGTAGKTDPAKGGILDICFPPGASAPTVGQGAAAAAGAGAGGAAGAAAGGGGLFGLGVPATIAIIGGGTAAALTPLAFQSNPSGAQ
ncbi:MAG: hypothetical protein C5B55_14935 [Blastocatellia bacterium]|nr:MAG: hypothetical protein C5B55_14935 [Blastocatellia bacterium]